MPYKDRDTKNAKARALWLRNRQEELLRLGIDPLAVPVREDGKRGKAYRPRKDTSLPEWLILEMVPKLGESEAAHTKRRNRLRSNYYNSLMTPEERDAKNALVRERYLANNVHILEKRKISNAANPLLRSYAVKYYEANREKRLTALKKWCAENPDRYKAARDNWFKANRAVMNKHSAAYRAQLNSAAPEWTDWEAIAAIYADCAKTVSETGIQHNVDHIIPIRGKDVCGLHVWWNLRIITESDNCKKGNRWTHEDGVAPMQ